MFFYIALALLASAHLYLFLKLCRTFIRGKWRILTAVWFAAMLGAWWHRHFPDSQGLTSIYLMTAFSWYGFVFFAVAFLLLFDGIRLAATLFRPAPDTHATRFFQSRKAVPAALVLGLILSCYAVYEAHDVRPHHLTVPTDKLPRGVERYRIAAVSDVHISRFIGPYLLRKIVNTVNLAEPDLFVSLGDLVDRDIPPGSEEADLLRDIKARYGKFGVTGNHEFYHNRRMATAFHKEAGITLLRGTGIDAGPIRVIGVDDPQGARFNLAGTSRYRALREYGRKKRFTLFLSHIPKVSKRDVGWFDLQLSGHLHGGQIWPVSLLLRAGRRYSAWRSALFTDSGNRKSELFVTVGAGYNGPPMRFLVPPEVVIIDLVPTGE